MRPSRRDILIATRRSTLAVTQAELIGRRLQKLNPRVQVRYVAMESEGDRVTDHALAAIGGKGLFTRTIERTLLEKKADIAVHSLKDMPTEPTPGLVIAAIPTRLPVHDVLVSRHGKQLADLPHEATVGTCSPRRGAQVLRVRGDLKIVPMRGNVDTRLTKVLEQGVFDATLLAAAGLQRLGLSQFIDAAIPCEQVLPAAGQAALAVQCRVDDHISLRRCIPLNDAVTSMAVHAERQVVADLGANCHSPVAVLAEPLADGAWRIRARVLSPDGTTCLEADETGPAKAIRKISKSVSAGLIAQGAREVLREAAQVLSSAG